MKTKIMIALLLGLGGCAASFQPHPPPPLTPPGPHPAHHPAVLTYRPQDPLPWMFRWTEWHVVDGVGECTPHNGYGYTEAEARKNGAESRMKEPGVLVGPPDGCPCRPGTIDHGLTPWGRACQTCGAGKCG